MASIYKKPDGPHWWLRTKVNGVWKSFNTGLKYDSEIETSKAEILRAEHSLSEKLKQTDQKTNSVLKKSKRDQGWGWVEEWIPLHCKTDATLKNYSATWKHIVHWLTLNGLHHPSLIKFAHGQEYVAWRVGRKARHRVCKKNTALQDIKFFKLILTQAARIGLISANPIGKLGIAKDKTPRKKEITNEGFEACLELLKIEPEWMQLSFQIGMHTGCRLSETSIPMENIDFSRGTITFGDPKGGETKAFTRPLPEELIAILKPLQKRKVTHEIPANHASRSFVRFFKRAGLNGVTFHSLRVSYITRLHRAGVPLAAAMRLVNHSSEAVHEIYNRLGVDDVMPYRHLKLFSSTIEENPASLNNVQPEEMNRLQPTQLPSCKTHS